MRHRDFGLLHCDQHRATPGVTLFSPINGKATYIIGLRGDVLHQWEHPLVSGPYAYLLGNGNLLWAGRLPEGPQHMGGRGGLLREYDWSGKVEKVECDQILVTVGRRPSVGGIDIEKAGVKLNEKGFIPVDKQRRTNVAHIFAVGDIAGQPMLAHKASAEAEVAAEAIAGHKTEYAPATIPAVIFTDPEVATAGMSEPEAKAAGFELLIAKFPFGASGRAVAINEPEGFVRIIADKKTQRVLGVQIIGPEASDLISEAVLAIEMNAYLDDIALSVHPHPTLGEAVMEAAKLAIGAPVHVLPMKG